MIITYTFFPGSIVGLEEFVSVNARNFEEAKRKVLKNQYLDRSKELVVGDMDITGDYGMAF